MAILQKQNCCLSKLQLLVVLAGYYSCVTLLPMLIQRIQCLCKIFSGLVKFTQVHWLGKDCHTNIVTKRFVETTILLYTTYANWHTQTTDIALEIMTVGITQVHPKTPQLPVWLSLKQKQESCCGRIIVWY